MPASQGLAPRRAPMPPAAGAPMGFALASRREGGPATATAAHRRASARSPAVEQDVDLGLPWRSASVACRRQNWPEARVRKILRRPAHAVSAPPPAHLARGEHWLEWCSAGESHRSAASRSPVRAAARSAATAPMTRALASAGGEGLDRRGAGRALDGFIDLLLQQTATIILEDSADLAPTTGASGPRWGSRRAPSRGRIRVRARARRARRERGRCRLPRFGLQRSRHVRMQRAPSSRRCEAVRPPRLDRSSDRFGSAYAEATFFTKHRDGFDERAAADGRDAAERDRRPGGGRRRRARTPPTRRAPQWSSAGCRSWVQVSTRVRRHVRLALTACRPYVDGRRRAAINVCRADNADAARGSCGARRAPRAPRRRRSSTERPGERGGADLLDKRRLLPRGRQIRDRRLLRLARRPACARRAPTSPRAGPEKYPEGQGVPRLPAARWDAPCSDRMAAE